MLGGSLLTVGKYVGVFFIFAAAVKNIASDHGYPPEEVVNFFDCLETLVCHCDFDVNSTEDEDGKSDLPLLLRSVN